MQPLLITLDEGYLIQVYTPTSNPEEAEFEWFYEDRGCGREDDQPHVQGAVAAQARSAKWSYSMFKVRRGGSEEIPLIQGKEQQLRFAGAAAKRHPTSKVRETQVRR